ncbi:MAG: hypothetical protein ACREC4_02775, partial [Methylocella sp.]
TGHLVPLLDISNTFTAVQQFGQVLFQPAAFAPPATFNNGSIGKGTVYHKVTRTGGSPQYGLDLINYLVTANIQAPDFDVARTSWATCTNLGPGGTIFGSWSGANSPAQALGQTWTAPGSYIGMAINAGNRWGNLGILNLLSGSVRYGIVLQIGPDTVPTSDATALYTVSNITIAAPGVVTVTGSNTLEGMSVFFQTSGGGVLPTGLTAGTQYFVRNPTADTFQVATAIGGTPINTTGTFTATVLAQLLWPTPWGILVNAGSKGSQLGVGYGLNRNTIQKDGFGHYDWGSSSALAQPTAWTIVDGLWNRGLDLSSATFSSGQAIKLASGDSIYLGTARVSASGVGDGITITTSATTDFGILSGNNGAQVAVKWRSNAGAPQLGFFGATPIAQPASYGTPTNVVKTANLAGTSATLAQVGGTLAALIADLKAEGIIGA